MNDLGPLGYEYDPKQRFAVTFSLPAKAGCDYPAGHLLCTDTTCGLAALASDAANRIVLGAVTHTVHNRHGLNGDQVVAYTTGAFLYQNSATHPLTQAWHGLPVYIEDSLTVSTSPGNHGVYAGIFRGFQQHSSYVWIDTNLIPFLAQFLAGNSNSNYRYLPDGNGNPQLVLWNQSQNIYQGLEIAGASGQEHLIIGPVD